VKRDLCSLGKSGVNGKDIVDEKKKQLETMTLVKAVMFRADAAKPEFIDIDIDNDSYDKLADLVNADEFKIRDVVDNLVLIHDPAARLNGKPQNACLDSLVPGRLLDYAGDVLFLRCKEYSAHQLFVDVTDADLVTLASTLKERAEKQEEFVATADPFAMGMF
jgi:hypothetical protein